MVQEKIAGKKGSRARKKSRGTRAPAPPDKGKARQQAGPQAEDRRREEARGKAFARTRSKDETRQDGGAQEAVRSRETRPARCEPRRPGAAARARARARGRRPVRRHRGGLEGRGGRVGE